MVLLFLAASGGWLATDFWQGHQRILEDASRLATQQSQFMSRSFADTFLAADYVMRDVIGRTDVATDLFYPNPDVSRLHRLETMLREKAQTVPALEDLNLFNGECRFVAFAKRAFHGRKSSQSFCASLKVEPGQQIHAQYLPASMSMSKRAVIVMSRTVGSPEGRLLFGAMVVLDLEYAQNWITGFTADQHDVLAIIDNTDGTLLAHNPPLPETIGRRIPAPANQLPLDAVTSVASFTARSPLDARERIFGMSKPDRFPFVVLVGFDKSRLLAGWQRRAWQSGAGFVVLVLLTVLVLRTNLITLRQREEMRKLATTDALTGIANRRHLMQMGEDEVARTVRYGNPLSVLLLDIDRFKSVNDTWGHPAGDCVIRELANVMRSLLRKQDVCGRLGGEEFVLILPETDLPGARIIAERLRTTVQESAVVVADGGDAIEVTVSIGIATMKPGDASFEAVLGRADKAVYQAKAEGRNRVAAA